MNTSIEAQTPAVIAAIETAAEAAYQSLVDDIRAMVVERIFNARWEVILLYHGVGKRLVTDSEFQKHARGNGYFLATLSQYVNVSERDLYRSIQFYEKFPDLDLLPEGKNISWSKIVNKYLPEQKENGRNIPSISVDIAFDRYKKSALYIYENYPDWFDAMLQYMMDLRRAIP